MRLCECGHVCMCACVCLGAACGAGTCPSPFLGLEQLQTGLVPGTLASGGPPAEGDGVGVYTADTPTNSELDTSQPLKESDGHPARPQLGWRSGTPPPPPSPLPSLCPSSCLSWRNPHWPGLCELCPHAHDFRPSMPRPPAHPQAFAEPRGPLSMGPCCRVFSFSFWPLLLWSFPGTPTPLPPP